VEKGACMHDKDIDGETALLSAARHGNLEVVKWLLENGSSLNDKK